MNDTVYRLTCRAVRALLRVRATSRLMTTFSRAWLRQSRIATFLRAIDFDGVIDGGANIGEIADLVRDTLPAADLVAVEPHPDNARRLRAQGHRVVEAALWNERGELTLSQPGAASTSCTVVDTGSGPSWPVQAVRLEDIGVAGKRVLVKLDLQGAEPQALDGMGALWTRCAALLVEVSFGERGTYPAIAQLLSERGFDEYATFNELEVGGIVIEADKVWVARDVLAARRTADAGRQA